MEFGFAEMDTKTLVNTLKMAPGRHFAESYLPVHGRLRALMESERLPLSPLIEAELKEVHKQIPPVPSCASPKSSPSDRTQEDPKGPRRT